MPAEVCGCNGGTGEGFCDNIDDRVDSKRIYGGFRVQDHLRLRAVEQASAGDSKYLTGLVVNVPSTGTKRGRLVSKVLEDTSTAKFDGII